MPVTMSFADNANLVPPEWWFGVGIDGGRTKLRLEILGVGLHRHAPSKGQSVGNDVAQS
jgi:hypothetical protein